MPEMAGKGGEQCVGLSRTVAEVVKTFVPIAA